MAVYKKAYRRYEGSLTPAWSRFLILPRYSFEEMRQRRFFGLFFVGTLIYPIICALVIYLHHNLGALLALKIEPQKYLSIDSGYFLSFLGVQSMFAFFLTAFVGPGLVSPDLANNALSLYLARPFSRTEYVVGKISVLAILLSVMTWIPGLALFGLQSYLAGGRWFAANLRIAAALFAGSWVWIAVLSLLVLALSAWVKWKPVAGGLLFIVVFAGAAIGNATSQLLGTPWGQLVNISHLVGSIWTWLFGIPVKPGAGALFFRVQTLVDTPLWPAGLALAGFCLISLRLLAKKVRGMEVVK